LKVRANELSIPERASFFRDVLRPYVKGIPLGSFLIGTILGAREILTDPDGAATKHPVFELISKG
jgi:hypothetical protein